MTNFKTRVLTGIALVTVIIGGIWLGPVYFAGLLLIINMLSLREFYRLLETQDTRPAGTAGYFLSGSLIITTHIVSSGIGGWEWLLLNLPVGFGIFVASLYGPGYRPFQSLAVTFLGIICICLPLCCFLALPFLPKPRNIYHAQIPLSVFLLLWSNDSGAYLCGKLTGRHPLFERISPKKTWEGSVGGAMVCLLMGYLISRHIPLLTTADWVMLTFIIIISGTYGDLIKSLLKRSLNVKDSGTILPGHGGMLDRFDSLLGSAPFILIYLIMVWR